MKRPERITLAAIGVGAASTFGFWWVFPSLPWWVYALIWPFAIGILNSQWTKYAANETIVDREKPPSPS